MSSSTEKVTFAQEFEHRLSALETKVFPKGWVGHVEAEIAAAARKAGALVEEAAEKLAGREPPADVLDGTNAEMKGWLDERQVPVPAGANKAALQALIIARREAEAEVAGALEGDDEALTQWLQGHEVDVPDGADRTALEALAQQWLSEQPSKSATAPQGKE